LEDGLLEVFALFGVEVEAVADADVVLGCWLAGIVYAGKRGELYGRGGRTWYLVRSVLQTPVTSIIATRNGIKALTAILSAPVLYLLKIRYAAFALAVLSHEARFDFDNAIVFSKKR
jgi:hypothetical protein